MTPTTRRTLEFILDNLVWFMLLVVLAAFSAFVPNYFQLGIFANIIEASSVLGVMSIGLALVIIAGHMDLSVESVAALSAMTVGILFCSSGIGIGLQLHPDWLMVPVSLAIALAVGGIIGAPRDRAGRTDRRPPRPRHRPKAVGRDRTRETRRPS